MVTVLDDDLMAQTALGGFGGRIAWAMSCVLILMLVVLVLQLISLAGMAGGYFEHECPPEAEAAGGGQT